MNHRPGLDRSQTLLFPERLEDYIAPENPVRFLDAFVAKQDLSGLGFTQPRAPACSALPGSLRRFPDGSSRVRSCVFPVQMKILSSA
jgi:hypothetical protein